MNTVDMQPLVFLACLGAGVFSALFYGFLYVVRVLAKGRKAVELLADAVFVSVAATSYFLVLFYTGFGEMRFYTVAAFLGGFFALYALLYPLKDKVRAHLTQGKSIKPHLGRLFKKGRKDEAKQ